MTLAFMARTGLNIFRPSFHYGLSSVHKCEDRFHIHLSLTVKPG